MSMTKREKTLIIIVLILAVFFVYYMYFLQPCLKELDALGSDKTNKTQIISTNEQIQEKLTEIDKRITDGENEIKNYSGNILSDFDQPSVLVYLSDIVSKYGTKLTITFEQVSDVTAIKVNKVMVSMYATHEGLKSILKALDEGEYYLKVTGITATSNNQDETAAITSLGEAVQNALAPAEPSAPALPDDALSITMMLEFYNFGGEIPPDKAYPFTDGESYGGDIFY